MRILISFLHTISFLLFLLFPLLFFPYIILYATFPYQGLYSSHNSHKHTPISLSLMSVAFYSNFMDCGCILSVFTSVASDVFIHPPLIPTFLCSPQLYLYIFPSHTLLFPHYQHTIWYILQEHMKEYVT